MTTKRKISKLCKCGCGEIVRRTSHSFVKGHRTSEFRFWSKVKKIKGGCWCWTGSDTGGGQGSHHGRIVYRGRLIMASHFMWTVILKRKMPAGQYILHDCDNPRCVRPSHLFVGSLSQNTQQMWDRERRSRRSPLEKVPREHFPEILERIRQGGQKAVKEIALEYGVTVSAIEHIKYGRRKPLT